MAGGLHRLAAMEDVLDCLIVGGGPAGLSAALLLGRCRRRVLVLDSGQPRNRHAHRLHGFLTRDGTPPLELLALARAELAAYPGVTHRTATVTTAWCEDGGFTVECADGARWRTRTLLIATGLTDTLPPLDGAAELYGRGVLHCPYCDGWEIRDRPVAVYDSGAHGAELALELTGWTRDVVLCTGGGAPPPAAPAARHAPHGIAVRPEPVRRLEGHDGWLQQIVFTAGPPLARDALFFDSRPRQHSRLLADLGFDFTPRGDVDTGTRQRTALPGLYVAGDACRSVRLAIVAAAEGVEAAFDINAALLKADTA